MTFSGNQFRNRYDNAFMAARAIGRASGRICRFCRTNSRMAMQTPAAAAMDRSWALRYASRQLPQEGFMALVIEGEERISAPIHKVWEALNDADVLRASIPGCQSLEKKSDSELAATVVLKIGPIKATFAGEVTLANLNPPHSYTISGEGKGGVAGFAKGGADVKLAEDGPGTTVLTYEAKADVGGKIAQLGSRLIQSTSKKLAGQFFATFNEKVSGS
jgi:carbon monoxide dehydrogenase subunit G